MFVIQFRCQEQNFQDLIDAEALTIKPRKTPSSEFDWNHYFHLDTIYRWMNKLIAEHDFVTGLNLGTTSEGVVIRGLKISRRSGNTGIFIESGIHAREWIAPAVATFIIDQLIRSNDSDVVDIATNFDWYFVPVLNADGYKVSFEHDRLWRKNTKPYGKTRGVDLNRNFDINWGGIGSSHVEGTYDFCGSAPFSEPESRAVKIFLDEFAKENRIKTYFALHSFSQLFMFPYGHTTEPARNYEDLKKIGEKAVEAIEKTHGRIYQTGSAIETIYPSSGSSRGFVYDNYDIPIVFSIELRGPKDSPNLFILPADEIIPTGEEILNSFIAALNEARRLGYYTKDEFRSSKRQ